MNTPKTSLVDARAAVVTACVEDLRVGANAFLAKVDCLCEDAMRVAACARAPMSHGTPEAKDVFFRGKGIFDREAVENLESRITALAEEVARLARESCR